MIWSSEALAGTTLFITKTCGAVPARKLAFLSELSIGCDMAADPSLQSQGLLKRK